MHSDLDYVESRLNTIPKPMEALRVVFLRYLDLGYCVDEGAVRLGRHRKYEHDHYHITIFPPADGEWLVRTRSFEPPLDYLQVLSWANGLTIFGLNIFGFTPSLQADHPGLDRTKNQCLDVTKANETWIIGYKNAPSGCVFIGDRAYSNRDNSGYFMSESGAVVALLKSGAGRTLVIRLATSSSGSSSRGGQSA